MDPTMDAFAVRVRENQRRLAAGLRDHYDFVVCGAGSSGAVIARRLAERGDASVLLVEAGGTDEVPAVQDATQWSANLGSERDWGFQSQPNPALGDRTIELAMGRVLGGGSSINAGAWARGHRSDWDHFAAEAGNPRWGCAAVREIYRAAEDWHGAADPAYRGAGGPMWVEQEGAGKAHGACIEAARSIGIESFDMVNGRLNEASAGCSWGERIRRGGERVSVFRGYTYPVMDRLNLTVLTEALVTRLVFAGRRVNGIELAWNGEMRRIMAGREVILSLGAMNTPKLLMQSGIGDAGELRRLGVTPVQHLPGVGQNFQDHPRLFAGCSWAYPGVAQGEPSSVVYCQSDSGLAAPDIQILRSEGLAFKPHERPDFELPASGWRLMAAVMRPNSRGHLRLTGSAPLDPVEIHANMLSDPGDLRVLVRAIEICREMADTSALRPFAGKEITPGGLTGKALEAWIRRTATSYHHQCGTAKVGCDAKSVVDGKLKVHGVEGVRIADASITPRITTGNTMAPCVVIGEIAARLIIESHGL
jgi:choline dehydrogenase